MLPTDNEMIGSRSKLLKHIGVRCCTFIDQNMSKKLCPVQQSDIARAAVEWSQPSINSIAMPFK